MKRIALTIICVFIARFVFAQQELLSFDEHNKYIYYQVVEAPGILTDSLELRCANFFKTDYPKYKIKNTKGNGLNVEGKLVTYNGVSVLRHESGEVNFKLNAEFKDQKYRYWLTDFTFTPYERDRYGNFVPKLGGDIPLETAQSKLEKKDLDNYLNQTGAFCKQLGERLKQFIMSPPKKETAAKKEEVKKVVTDKW